ncbi:MAG: DUF4838 domain-containing protein [Candidatus Omnitrophica bacterium]|nr:DUF4838 domain-containing protein [Candidatus Omnitrophota bacterium]
MLIEYSNLSDERKIFLNRELADILYLCRKRKIQVPEININVVSLLSPAEIPESIRNQIQIRIPERSQEKKSFAELCEWEKSIQSSQIIFNGEKVWVIGGGEEGSIYGFYETIKKITGIRWYGTSETDIFFVEPTKKIEKIYTPIVPLRGFEFSPKDDSKDFAKKFLKWMVRNGWNLLDINAAMWEKFSEKGNFIKNCETYGIRIAIGCHAIDFFVPETLFPQNPEFFGLRNGKRCITAEVSSPEIKRKWKTKIQPCYSNPRMRKFLIDTIKNFIESHPEIYIFSLWPLDGINNWCQCDECIKVLPYEVFYNIALELNHAIGRFLPIELLCYSNMFHLPDKILPESSNTYTIFCPYLRHYKHRFFDEGFCESLLTLGKGYPEAEPINPSDDREYGILLNKWLPFLEKIGSKPGLFSYYQLVFHDETQKSDRQRYLYHPDPKLVEEEIKKFIECGIKVFYDCSPPYPGFWPDGRFYAYLSHLFWENSQPVEKSIKEYYTGISKERAEVLHNILKRISGILDRNENLPEEVLRTAKSIFSLLQSPMSERYLLWLEYIKMGRESWQAKKTGNINLLIQKENEIINFFEQNRNILEECVNVDWMIRHSRSIIDFYSNS